MLGGKMLLMKVRFILERDEENAWKTTQNNATPQNTLRFKDTKPNTTFAQRKHMYWRTQTLIQNTAGQEDALRHRTTLQTLGNTPPR